jgi:preprotein translocase subunit SecA
MLQSVLTKFFGSKQERDLKKFQPLVEHVSSLEPSVKEFSDEQLRSKTDEFKERLAKGETLDDLLPEAYAVVREAAIRTLGQRHYDVQVMGAIVLHQGRIAEMKTGEGKTLASTMPAYLNALTGEGVHIITPNYYLAYRDSEWMGAIYRFLGLSVGLTLSNMSVRDGKLVTKDMTIEEKKQGYNADITYGTNDAFGFDYLRDNKAIHPDYRVQRELNYAIVDEVDSILVDEARTPLILSDRPQKTAELYYTINRIIPRLKRDVDYSIEYRNTSRGTVALTEEGTEHVERLLGVSNLYDMQNIGLVHHVEQALAAHTLWKRDVDYVVKDGKVIIVDEFTGRLQPGRRWSDGLHQAMEAKERVRIEEENLSTARITYQNYFRLYNKLAGMTGTAETEAAEFSEIYKLDVSVIPTNEPMIRMDHPDVIYRTEKEKFNAIIEEIVQMHEIGRPVLVGTRSIETSERLSRILKQRHVPHHVLNAKHHEKEAEIISHAGEFGAVTIATNMAGRGVDIFLGERVDFSVDLKFQDDLDRGNISKGLRQEFENKKISFSSKAVISTVGAGGRWRIDDGQQICLIGRTGDKLEVHVENPDKRILELGGLHITGTERHESRRIDNQLRGRSGRQGDPGSSRFYLSLEDEIMQRFGSERLSNAMEWLGMKEGIPIEHPWVTKAIENAQKRVEAHYFEYRKHVLKYDDVNNTQRSVIYEQRDMVLEGEDLKNEILSMLEDTVDDYLDMYVGENIDSNEWDVEALIDWVDRTFLVDISRWAPKPENLSYNEIREKLLETLLDLYEGREKSMGSETMRKLEQFVMLDRIDDHWVDHLYSMDYMQEGIHLQAYGQKDPLVEFKREAHEMFSDMIQKIKEEVVEYMFKVQLVEETQEQKTSQRQRRQRRAAPRRRTAVPMAEPVAVNAPAYSGGSKVGRNDPCPCGSGKKYKKCCGR